MNAAALRRPSQAPRRMSTMIETGSNARSAMIMTSAQTTRDGQSTAAQAPYENTYKVEPEESVSSSRLREVVKRVLEKNLTGREYSFEECGAMTRTIADQIKHSAKSLGIPRYKYVSLVTIGPPQPATISISSRCVWNSKYDTFAEYVFQNQHIYAVGIVYGMYFE